MDASEQEAHIQHMKEALKEANAAGSNGDLPIGSVVVFRNQIVGRGRNQTKSRGDKLRHAEIAALEDCRSVRGKNSEVCTIYTTTEPCVMCLGAIVMADIRRVIFALPDTARGGTDMFENVPYVQREIGLYQGGVLEEESRALWLRYQLREP